MIRSSDLRLVTALRQKKFRQQHGLFVAEGVKVVGELVRSGLAVRSVYATGDLAEEASFLDRLPANTVFERINARQLQQISQLAAPQGVVAVAEIPAYDFDPSSAGRELVLALDDVSDPGNLGTILRVADWFGIRQVVCSRHTVDAYNPKVVQAAMGSLFRMQVTYADLEALLSRNSREGKSPVYGTVLDGENIYTAELEAQGYILLGKESTGIGPGLLECVSRRLTVPMVRPQRRDRPESLNVAVTAAIVCSEFRRRHSG